MTTIPAKDVHRAMMHDLEYRKAWEESDLPMMLSFELCDARRRAKLSRAEVAQRVEASEAMVHSWERGTCLPSLTSLRQYAKATGTHLKIELLAAADESTVSAA